MDNYGIAEFRVAASSNNAGELDLSGLGLSSDELQRLMPLIIRKRPGLEKLKLNGNQLKELPEQLGELTNLRELDLSSNKLVAFPEAVLTLQNLEILNFDQNGLSELPQEIQQLVRLKELRLEGNKFEAVPQAVLGLVDLEVLRMDSNKIAEIPQEIRGLQNLKELGVGDNPIIVFPSELLQLQNLTTLNLRKAGLTYLPQELVTLAKLKELDLSENQLALLPSSMGRIKDLEVLFLDNNRFATLQKQLFELANLKTLSVRNNQLTAVDRSVQHLSQIAVLDLTGNPLEAKAMIFLHAKFKDRVKFNKAPFRANTAIYSTLNTIYDQTSYFNFVSSLSRAYDINHLNIPGPFTDEQHKILNAQQVVYSLLVHIPREGPRANNLYFESYRDLIDPVMEDRPLAEKKNRLQGIAVTLGDCATPVLNMLVQQYMGKHLAKEERKRPSSFEAILAREALEKEISRKLANATDENGERIMPNNERIEQVQGLVNAVFFEGAADHTLYTGNGIVDNPNKVKMDFSDGGPKKLPSKTANIKFAFEQVRPALATAFAKLVCNTNEDGTLQTNNEGCYVFDPKKMERIVNKYKNTLGDTSARENLVNKYEREMQTILQENTDLYDHFEKQEVKDLYEFQSHKERLGDRLYGEADDTLNEEYEKFIEERITAIQKVMTVLGLGTVDLPAKWQSAHAVHDLSALETPLNRTQESEATRASSSQASSSQLSRSTSRGRGI